METVLPALLQQPAISVDAALSFLSAPCCVVVGFVCLSGFTRVTMIVKEKKVKKKQSYNIKAGLFVLLDQCAIGFEDPWDTSFEVS